MAALSDSMGNTINGSLQELRAAMLNNTNSVRFNTLGVNSSTTQTTANTGELQKLTTAMRDLKTVFESDLKQTLNDLKTAIASMTTSSTGGSGGDTEVKDKLGLIYECLCTENQDTEEADKTTFFMKALKKEFKKQEFWKGLMGAMTDAGCCGGGKGGGGGGDKPPGSPEPTPTSGEVPKPKGGDSFDYDAFGRYFGFDTVSVKVLGMFEKVNDKFEKVFFDFGEKMSLTTMALGDMAAQEVNFAREVKKTVFEVNNLTGEFQKGQEAYVNLGESVLETGVNRTKYQEEYLKNLKAGIRDEKKLQVITKQTLATENMLGLKAGELTDSFRELVLAGKMNSAQVAAMGRGMQEVSRNTGLTGENLKKAFEATKPFIKSLQNAATLTASSAQNVMNVVAESQKLGVEDSVAPLLKSATSTVELIRNSSQEVQAFLYNAAGNVGKIQELQYGIITRSKKGMKDLAKGMEMVLQDFGVRSLEEVENLPDEVKFRLNLQLKGAFGMELGEMTRTIEAFKEAGKGVSDRLNEINAKRQLSLNMEEKAALAEQERQLKAKAAMDVLTGFSEAAKGAQSMDIAFSNFSRRAGDFREEIQAFGGDLGSMQGGLKSALMAATSNLNEALKKQGEKEISIDASEIEAALKDKKQLNVLIDRIEAGNNKLQNAQKAATDPTLQTARTLEAYNDYFRNSYSGPLLQGILSIVGFSGIMATALTFIASKMALSAGIGLKKYGEDLMDMFGFGSKGGGRKKRKSRGGGGDGGPEVTCPVPTMNLDPKKLMKNAAQLAGLAVALGALGAALLYLGTLVSDKVPNPIKTAVAVTTIIAAGAIIMTEAGLVLAALYEADKAFGAYFTPQALQKAGILALKLSAAAVVFAGLSIAVLKIVDLMSGYAGIDAAKAYEIGETIFAIGLAVGELTLGLVAAIGIVVGVGAAMKALAAGMPFIYWFAGIGTFVLPIAAGALALIGLGVIKVVDILSYMAYPDSGQLEEAIEKVEMIAWATMKLALAIGIATAGIIGLAALGAKLISTLPLWKSGAIFAGVALVLVGPAMVLIAWGIEKFFSYLGGIDADSIAAGAENAFKIIDTINWAILKLAPIFVVLAGMAIGLAVLKASAPAVFAAIVPMMKVAAALVFLSPLIAAGLTLLARAIIGLVTATANMVALDPDAIKEDMAKFDLIMDTTYKILAKLGILFGIIVGMSGAITALIVLAPVAAGIMAAVAAVLVLTLPAIAAGLVGLGIAIINSIKTATSGFTLDKKEVDEMVAKIDTLGNAITTIGAAVAKFAGKGLFAAADNIAKFSTQLGSFISTLGNLKTATSGLQPNEMKDLASNLTSLMESTRAVFGIIAETQKFQITGAVLGTGLQNANTTLTNSTGEIVLLIKNLTDLGQRVVLSTMQIDSKKVVESFKDIGNFTKSVEKFMSTVAKIKPNKNFKKNAKEMFMKSGLSEPLGDMLKEFKKVAEVQKTAGINRNDLIMTTELLTKVGDFTLNLTKAVENFEKSSKMLGPKGFLSKKNEYGDGETIKTNLVKIMETAKTIVSAMIPYATDKALGGQLGVAVAQMQEIGPIFEQLALSVETFSKGAKKIAEISVTKKGFFWDDVSLIDTLEESVKTGRKVMSRFANTVRVIFESFKLIVKASVDAKQTPQAMKDTATTLEQLKTALSQFTTSASSFGEEMKGFFKNDWWGWSKGAGTFLSENSEKISKGFADTFSIIQNIKTTFDGFDVANSKSIIDKTNAAGQFAKDVAAGLNYFTDSLYALNDLIKGGSQGAGWFGTSAKFPAYEFLTKTSVWNEYVKNFGSLEYVPMIFTHVTAGLEKGFNAFGNMSWSQLQKKFDDLLKAVETLAKFPMAVKALSDAVSTIANMRLPDKSQTDAVAAQSTPVTSMLTAFSSIINALGSAAIDFAKSQKALENVKNIDSVIMPLVNTLKSFEANIYTPVNTNTGMLSPANTKNMQDVGTAITGFLESFVKIMRAVDANGSLKESDFASTIVKIQQIASISTLLSSSLTTFSKELSLFNVPDPTTGVTKAQELTNSAKGIADALTAISDLMTILKTTVNKVPGDEELTNISKKITALGGAATGIKDLFESVNKVMLILNDKQTFGNVSMIDGTTATLKEVIKSTGQNKIANMIQLLVSGIFAPLLNLKAVTEKGKAFYLDADDLEETSKIIVHISTGIGALASMFESLNIVLIKMGELHKAGPAAGAMPAQPGPTAKDTKTLTVAGSTFERLDIMLKEHSPTIAKIIQSVGGIMANFMSGPWANIDSEDVKEVGAVLSGVQSIFGMFSGDKSILTTINNALLEVAKLPQGAPEYEDGLQIPDGDEVLPPSFIQQVEGLAKFIGQLMDPISMIIFTMDNMGGKDVFIDSADIKEAGAMLSGISDMLTTLPQIIKTLSTELPNIMKEIPMINSELAKAGGNTPEEQGRAVANLFNNSFLFLGGLFSNITAKFEGAQELGVATDTLAAIVPFTTALVAHMPTISDNMNKMIAMDLTAFLAPPPQGVKELFVHVGHYAIILIETNMPEIANNLSVAADGIVNVGSNFENFYSAWQANVSNISTKFNEIVAYDLTLATAVDYASARTFFSALNEYVEMLAYFDLDTLAENLEMAADTIPAVGFGMEFLGDVFYDNMPMIKDNLDYIGSFQFTGFNDIGILGMGMTFFQLHKLTEMFEEFQLDVIAESINMAAENIWDIDEAVSSLIEAYGSLMTSMSSLTDISSLAGVIEGLQFAASFSAAGQIAVSGGDNAARQEVATRVNMSSSDLLDGAVAAATQATAENTSILVQQNDAIIGILQGMSSMGGGGGEEDLPGPETKESDYNPSKFYAYANLTGSSVLGSPNFMGKKG
jgi:hypothetical protein